MWLSWDDCHLFPLCPWGHEEKLSLQISFVECRGPDWSMDSSITSIHHNLWSSTWTIILWRIYSQHFKVQIPTRLTDLQLSTITWSTQHFGSTLLYHRPLHVSRHPGKESLTILALMEQMMCLLLLGYVASQCTCSDWKHLCGVLNRLMGLVLASLNLWSLSDQDHKLGW